MLCQNCHQREAVTQVRQVMGGKTVEYLLCASCAQKLGYNALFTDAPSSLGEMLSSILSCGLAQNERAEARKTRCPQCGMTFEEIVHTGRAGCPACYETFFEEITPSIERIHGKVSHMGKAPMHASNRLSLRRELERLQQKLTAAVQAQEFEQAAVYRDEIAQLRIRMEETA